MATADHLDMLTKGASAWNAWRAANPSVRPDLQEASLDCFSEGDLDLRNALLTGASMRGAHLWKARLDGAVLRDSDLHKAYLEESALRGADIRDANLSGANLCRCDLRWARLKGANLEDARLSGSTFYMTDLQWVLLSGAWLNHAQLQEENLSRANLSGANLCGANLKGSDLSGANLRATRLRGANLDHADLQMASLVETDLTNASLRGCRVYGSSVWRATLEGSIQADLIVTPYGEHAVTVDNIEIAQLIQLLLSGHTMRAVIDAAATKLIFLMGRFTPERKAILNDLRHALRQRGFVPVVFDFEPPTRRDFTETTTILSNLSYFVIADVSDPSSVPHELATIVGGLHSVPVVLIHARGTPTYVMLRDLQAYGWVLGPIQYGSNRELINSVSETIIGPAEALAQKLRAKREGKETE